MLRSIGLWRGSLLPLGREAAPKPAECGVPDTPHPPVYDCFAAEREHKLPRHGFVVSPVGLFTDAEAGEDPSQQIIRAEGAGNFAEEMLSLAKIFGQQFSGPRQGQLCTTVFQGRAGVA